MSEPTVEQILAEAERLASIMTAEELARLGEEIFGVEGDRPTCSEGGDS